MFCARFAISRSQMSCGSSRDSFTLPTGPGVKMAALVVCHVGPAEQAKRDLQTVALELGSPIMSEVGPMPYPAVNMMFDDAYPRGALNYWKSSFVRDLSDRGDRRVGSDDSPLHPRP